ncbi:polyphosphate kinase 2 family protein [Gluconobacter sp. OJB]|uniref:polyphosphate kinase 2 family protein n=1 Tax=Gluconobacter sp. OJB TaxID=3145196 RepID=UPI0031F90D1E
MDLRRKLIVKPRTIVRLKNVDASYHAHYKSEYEAEKDIENHQARVGEHQQKLYAEKKHALLIVLQGIDAAGKDGTCWHVMKAMNPQGTSIQGFKQPTEEEKLHDFLWRVHPHTPGRGQVGVFNRSHYEDVLVTRVHDLVPKKIWSNRYDLINDFEKMLVANNVTILKFFLYITPEEQLERFRQRLDDPARQWKISDSDYKEREYWDKYTDAYQDMMEKCSTKHAPWYIIPSNNKWFRNLAVSNIIWKTLQDMNLAFPEPTVDIEKIREEYHQAKEKNL